MQCDGQDHRAFILDLSPNGLFIQTPKAIDPGTEVSVQFRVPVEGTEIDLRAKVARSKRVPPRLATVTTPGIGLRISSAPAAYYEYLARLVAGEKTEKKAAAPEAETQATETSGDSEPRYRVRAQLSGGSRSRSLVVWASTAMEARQEALSELDEGWKILSVEPF